MMQVKYSVQLKKTGIVNWFILGFIVINPLFLTLTNVNSTNAVNMHDPLKALIEALLYQEQDRTIMIMMDYVCTYIETHG